MAIYTGTCKVCGTQETDIFSATNLCIICTRLEDIEKRIEELEKKNE